MVKARKKDTVATVALRYKLAAADVAKWNSVSMEAAFKPGQKLMLMLPAKGRAKAKSAGKTHKH